MKTNSVPGEPSCVLPPRRSTPWGGLPRLPATWAPLGLVGLLLSSCAAGPHLKLAAPLSGGAPAVVSRSSPAAETFVAAPEIVTSAAGQQAQGLQSLQSILETPFPSSAPEPPGDELRPAASGPGSALSSAAWPSLQLLAWQPLSQPTGEGATEDAVSLQPSAHTDGGTKGDQSAFVAELPETFTLRIGAGWVLESSTTVEVGGRTLQAEIDWEDTLGGDTRGYSVRADAMYRFTPRHALTLSFYGLTREGKRTLDEEIEIGDETFPVDAELESELSLYITRLFYTYSFYRSKQVELGLNFGFYFGYVGLAASASTVAGQQVATIDGDQAILVPIPTVGLGLRYSILTRLIAFTGMDWFYLEAGDWKGSLTELYFGLEYRAFDHVGFGAAFDRLDINVEGTFSDDGSVDIENDWNIVYAFLSFYL